MKLYPSFFCHIANGMLLFLAILLVCKYYSKLLKLDPYRKITLVIVLSIAVGSHCLSHIAL